MRIADRFVYGGRATPYEVLTSFAGRVGEAYSTEDILPRMAQVLALVDKDERGKRPLCPHSPAILSQVEHAATEESALTVADFMLRRSMLGLSPCQGRDAVDTVAVEMGRLLGWNETQQEQQMQEYLRQADLGQRFRSNHVD